MDFYPEITDEDLIPIKLVLQAVKDDPEYLNSPDCPYSPTVIEFFQGQAQDPAVDTSGSWLETESAALYQQLKNFGSMLTPDDTQEQMAFFRTSTSLLEKIVSIRERAVGLKQISQFQTVVLQIMEDILDADQRTQVIDRLKEFGNEG